MLTYQSPPLEIGERNTSSDACAVVRLASSDACAVVRLDRNSVLFISVPEQIIATRNAGGSIR
jgi:hypothetical protein